MYSVSIMYDLRILPPEWRIQWDRKWKSCSYTLLTADPKQKRNMTSWSSTVSKPCILPSESGTLRHSDMLYLGLRTFGGSGN